MRVLILGCGPAGLIAAQAAADAGCDLAIASKKRKSYMRGAQYLHRPIPGVSADMFQVEYRLQGSPIGYRLKVYGPKYSGSVSPEDLTESHSGWDIRQTYDALWERFDQYVTDWAATPIGLHHLREQFKPDLTVSTLPAPLLCTAGHQFRQTEIWSTDSGSSMGLSLEENSVVCNGEEHPTWYRAARINGWETIEWPGAVRPPITPLWSVPKPTDNNCDCFPEVLRCGRYGSWTKGVLSHETYYQVTNRIKEMSA